jgi:hypothetical protein
MISTLDGRADKMTREGQARRVVVVVRRVVIVGALAIAMGPPVPAGDRRPLRRAPTVTPSHQVGG